MSKKRNRPGTAKPPRIVPAARTTPNTTPRSLSASANRLTTRVFDRPGGRKSANGGWQEDSWEMYDLVGEQRFLATTLAGRTSQARLFIGKADPNDSTADPEAVNDPEMVEILASLGDGTAGLGQLIYRLSINLFVAGEGWLAGIPRHLMPGSTIVDDGDELTLDDLEWRALSVSEVSTETNGDVRLHLSGDGEDGAYIGSPDDIYLIRIWRSHPRRAWEADSPTRSSLPVLRELVGLTMHISAQIDSRLAGAGVLLVAQSISDALRAKANIPADSDEDPFLDALMDAMITPIGDRSNASALVPLLVSVPTVDDVEKGVKHISFSTPLDAEARQMRDEAIRRLALGQDAPPELLLGVGGMNHWGAWLVREDVVTTHIEPPLALICDALTTQYLRPVLIEQGMTPEEAENYGIHYDTSAMIVRPNRGADAVKLYEIGELNATTLREANGFDESDAPTTVAEQRDPVVDLALQLVAQAPSLMQQPGLPSIVEQIKAAFGTPEQNRAAAEAAEEELDAPSEEIVVGESGDSEVPATEDDDAGPPAEIAASALGRSLIVSHDRDPLRATQEVVDRLVEEVTQ